MESREKSAEKKRGGGGKLSRSETVTVRLDPQLRYLIELAARKQRRTVSSYIEWALEGSLDNITLKEDGSYRVSIANEKHELWDVDEADRFAKLAFNYPEMLNHHEQVLWKLVRENEFFWIENKRGNQWQPAYLINERLRENWKMLNLVAEVGTGTMYDELRKNWKIPSSEAHRKAPPTDLDDKIPF